MILVDTNVWSELMRSEPDKRVRDWEKANASRLWLATVVIGELLSGVQLLPPGRRKQALVEGYEALISAHAERIVPFDLEAARHYAVVLARQERAGRNPGTADTQIAGIAIARRMKLATRNVKHFAGLGLELTDPWMSRSSPGWS